MTVFSVLRMAVLGVCFHAVCLAANPSSALESAKAVWLDPKTHMKVDALTLGDGRFARTYWDTSQQPEQINGVVIFDGNTVIDQTTATYSETAAQPEDWVKGRGATAVMECPWPMVPRWTELLRDAPDRQSETKNGGTREFSEKLGLDITRDAAGDLQSVRFTFGNGPKATFIQDDYSEFREKDGRKVPHRRIRTFNPKPDGKPGNPPQHFELKSLVWNPPDAEEALAYRKGKAVFDKRDTSGNIYAPDGRFKYNEKQLQVDMMAAQSGSQVRRSWAMWIVGGLVTSVVVLIALKYRKGW